jgi:predicted Zn-dependent protease
LTANLLALSFSRSDETDADNQSVEYLCETDFEADGAANFFAKIEAEGGSNPPAFLSTHPNPDDRVENIREMADMRECGTEIADPSIANMTYAQFRALLPR